MATEDFYNNFIVLNLQHGKAQVWTFETNFKDSSYIQL